MPIEIRMPQLDADTESADLVDWLVAPGDRIAEGDVILELETDKSTVEFEAPTSGVLIEIVVPAGSQGVAVGTVLARLESESAGDDDTPPAEPSPAAMAENDTAEGPGPPEARATQPTSPEPVAATPQPPARDLAQATALARRLADRAGLDLGSVDGSGARGRITKQDVERSIGSEAGASVAEQGPEEASEMAQSGIDAASTLEPHSRMRRTIASRLTEAKQTIPHFYLSAECRVDALLSVRSALNARSEDVKISVNDFIVRAAALGLRETPGANASWTDEGMRVHDSIDVSVAVATEAGLITPIVRAADRKGLATLSAEIRSLAESAREGRLSPRDYQGGTFSVSNLGMYGIDSVLAIINPPQACILGVGAASPSPVVEGGEIVVGTTLTLTLSADHRVVDGAMGAELLAAIKRRFEDPKEKVL